MKSGKKKILLVNLPFEKIYESTNIKGIAPATPPLSLACIAGSVLRAKHDAKIFDFNTYEDGTSEFIKTLKEYKPDFLGITFVTPLIKEADRISKLAKKEIPKIIIIGGGPHPSSFPESALKETKIDIGVIGEGDITIIEIIEGKKYPEIQGIAYKDKKKIIVNQRRALIENLDDLALPAHQLYDIKKYHVSSALARHNPVGWIETSRGCIFGCVYCNKSCFGRTFRMKSARRVVDEFKRMKEMGFKEIHLTDDSFTTKMDRVKEICDLLVKEDVIIPWVPITGIRVDKIDLELLEKMKASGCYKVLFGIESGSQKILNRIKKGITLEQVRKSVALSKKAGLEVAGAFMIGLPDETEKEAQETIDFAKELDLDYAKMSITIPLPATELFNELDAKGLIKTYKWEEFKFYSVPSSIYDHENMSWKTIEAYHRKFYRAVFLRPKYLLRRLIYSIKYKTFIDDAKIAISMFK